MDEDPTAQDIEDMGMNGPADGELAKITMQVQTDRYSMLRFVDGQGNTYVRVWQRAGPSEDNPGRMFPQANGLVKDPRIYQVHLGDVSNPTPDAQIYLNILAQIEHVEEMSELEGLCGALFFQAEGQGDKRH